MCIVQKRDSGRLFAMKYVSRGVLDGRGALGGVIKEVELLASLEHPFLVNLWFSFQGNFSRCCFTFVLKLCSDYHHDDGNGNGNFGLGILYTTAHAQILIVCNFIHIFSPFSMRITMRSKLITKF